MVFSIEIKIKPVIVQKEIVGFGKLYEHKRYTTTFIEKTLHIFTSRPETSIYTRDRIFIANNKKPARKKNIYEKQICHEDASKDEIH